MSFEATTQDYVNYAGLLDQQESLKMFALGYQTTLSLPF
jgi:hypothetical protein